MNPVIQNPGFYRAHQYRHQSDLPNSAFKNRQFPIFTSQIPQGKQYFQPSNKKHYKNQYRSQILQQNVFTSQYHQLIEQNQSKNNFRSLNVNDIQGAKPNTLISKAVKNKQKALSIKKQQFNLQNSRKKQLQYLKYLPNQPRQRTISNYQQNYQPRQRTIRNYQQNYLPQIDLQRQALQKYNQSKYINDNNSMINLNLYQQKLNPKNYHFSKKNQSMYLQNTNKKYQQYQIKNDKYTKILSNNAKLSASLNQNQNESQPQEQLRFHQQRNTIQAQNQNQRLKNYHKSIQDNNRKIDIYLPFNQQINLTNKNLSNNTQKNYQNNLNNNLIYKNKKNDNPYTQIKKLPLNYTPTTIEIQKKSQQNHYKPNHFPIDRSHLRKYYNPTFLSYQSPGIRFNQPIRQNQQYINMINDRNQRSIPIAASNIVQNDYNKLNQRNQ